MSRKIDRIAGHMIAALVTLSLAGCATLSSGSGNVRSNLMQTVKTAPTELQLACASELSKKFEDAGANVLPIYSEPTSAGTYEVILGFANIKARCIVGKDADVIDIKRVVL